MNDEELDLEIRNALGVVPAGAQVARLEAFWRQRARAEVRRRRVQRVAAVAASVLTVAGATWLATGRRQRDAVPKEQVAAQALEIEVHAVEGDGDGSAPSSGRPPTPYERLVFAERTSQGVPPEQAVLARLRQAPSVEERRRLADRLGEVGTFNSVSALVVLAAQDAVREEALDAIERIVGVERLGDVVRRAGNPRVRAALAGRMLAGSSDAVLSEFLLLAVDPATRGSALAAADAAEPLPVGALIARLESQDKSQRLAATIVLGHVNGPVVSEALIARVTRDGRTPVEAWVALMACRGPAVDQFLASAARQPRMLGQVNNARAFWARMIP